MADHKKTTKVNEYRILSMVKKTRFTASSQVKNAFEAVSLLLSKFTVKIQKFTTKYKKLVTLKNRKAGLEVARKLSSQFFGLMKAK